jgi:SRSO17 transposase
MNIKEAGKKYLQPLSLLIEGEHNQKTFEKYISGLMLENKNFSTLNISEHTEEKHLSQFYYFLEQSIDWRKLLYKQAKAVLKEHNAEEFILIIDSSPIKQEYAEHRITKKGFVNISEMERVPNNEVVGLYITNGKVYNPLEFKLWGSPKLVNKDQYKKKPAMLIEFLQYYGMNAIPVKRIVFDAFFNSKANLKWLIENGYTFITRIECNRIVYANGEKHVLKELGLKDGESIICELQGIKENLKILRFCYQDEEYYVVTNDLDKTDENLKQEYLDRWGVEVFHREAKQKLGLEKMLIRSWKRLTNRVGLICVVYGFLTTLEQYVSVSVGKMKRVIQDLIYSTRDGADRLGNLVFC